MKNILVIDDEKPLAKALELKLAHEGFNTKAVFDGLEAMRELATKKYDLALLDLAMPRQDGFKVLEEVQKKKIKTKMLVSSNLSQGEDQAKATALGAIDYFVKSDTTLAEIVEKVKKYLA